MEPADQVEKDLLQAALHAGGEVGVLRQDRLSLAPPLHEAAPFDGLHPEPALAIGGHGPAQLGEVHRCPVRRQRHHLVLVGAAPEPEVVGGLLVEQAQRMRQMLAGEDLDLAADAAPGQVGGHLTPPVEHQDAAGGQRGGHRGRGGVGDVVGDESHHGRVEAGQRRLQEQRRPSGVERAQPLPAVGGDVRAGRGGQARVERVGDGVEVLRGDTPPLQAPGGRLLGQLPGGERNGGLAVLAAAEAFLLGGGHDLAVDDERGSRIVEDGVDSQDVCHSLPGASPLGRRQNTGRKFSGAHSARAAASTSIVAATPTPS